MNSCRDITYNEILVSLRADSGELKMRFLILYFLVFPAFLAVAEGQQAPLPRPERIEFRYEGKQQHALGNILVEAEDGGVLLESRNQTIWPLQPGDIVSRQPLDESPEPLNKLELANVVLNDLPGGFQVYQTRNYVICYNTSRAYAEWCGSLFERLHRAFRNYWNHRDIDLEEAPPLVALVFRDRESTSITGDKN